MNIGIAMPLMYPVKHVFRNWKLFTALLIGVTLAATFCAAIGVKANLSAEEALDKQISNVLTDIQFTADFNRTNLGLAYRNISDINGVELVDMVAHFNTPLSLPSDNYSKPIYTQLTCFPNASRIYDEWENKPVGGIPENYTYLIAGTNLANRVKVGDNITVAVDFPTPKYYNTTTMMVNLTVAGFAILTNEGYSFVQNSGGGIYTLTDTGGRVFVTPPQISSGSFTSWRGDLMIISWENTLEKLWTGALESSTINVAFAVNVDRQNLISPWNTQASIQNIDTIADKIENEVMGNYLIRSSAPRTMLSGALYSFDATFQYTLLNFIFISIPIFFVAWYLGSTVSDVSFNIRRREIGLLSTKGLSSGQIQRMFLSEAVVIGLIGGLLGVVGGLILNQYYAGTVDLNNLFASRMFSPSIMIVTIIFGVILSLASVFWSSRKASRMPAVEALRDYVPMENKSRFRILAWIALIFGTYKMVVFALGLNIPFMMSQLNYARGDIFINIGSTVLLYFDLAMTYFGPFLFFWGLTKLLIRDSTKFQTVATKISSVMGDLGALAAKNVRRNPARLAAVAFLIAFIIGYSVEVTGNIASQQDLTVRRVQADVGAEVTATIANASDAEIIFTNMMANVSGIQNATIERSTSARLSEKYNTIQIRTIDVDTWGAAAYYEPGWFSGSSIDQMLKEMKANNNTIILDRAVAKQYNLQLYDEVGINFNSCPRKLRIIGFFGPEPPESQSTVIINGIPQKVQSSSFYSQYYSYVPRDLLNMTYGSEIYTLENFGTQVLIKLAQEANGTDVANQIRDLAPNDFYTVNSFNEQWRLSEERGNLSTYGNIQVLDIQGLGLVFAVISASVGTALIAIVSLKERSREATLMSVRGLSYRQLVWMFLTESMAIITFAVILGLTVGVIIVYGNVTSANATLSSYNLVTQRLIYPADALATIGTYVGLIYVSTIGAILVMTSQYVTKLEKMVRAR
jgi:ABC-type antimicrobial peptide transport system permease subunit